LRTRPAVLDNEARQHFGARFGFLRRIQADELGREAPCELIELPQNSLATTGDSGLSKSGCDPA